MKLGSEFYRLHPWLQQYGLQGEGTTLRPAGFLMQPLVALHYVLDGQQVAGAQLEVARALLMHPWKMRSGREIVARFLRETLSTAFGQAHSRLFAELELPNVGDAREFHVPPIAWLEPASVQLAHGDERLWTRSHAGLCRISLARAALRACTGCGAPLVKKQSCVVCGAAPSTLWNRLGFS